jgi:hypothetical protein
MGFIGGSNGGEVLGPPPLSKMPKRVGSQFYGINHFSTSRHQKTNETQS